MTHRRENKDKFSFFAHFDYQERMLNYYTFGENYQIYLKCDRYLYSISNKIWDEWTGDRLWYTIRPFNCYARISFAARYQSPQLAIAVAGGQIDRWVVHLNQLLLSTPTEIIHQGSPAGYVSAMSVTLRHRAIVLISLNQFSWYLFTHLKGGRSVTVCGDWSQLHGRVTCSSIYLRVRDEKFITQTLIILCISRERLYAEESYWGKREWLHVEVKMWHMTKYWRTSKILSPPSS